MDMWKAFPRSFEAHCPGVVILYDKFHAVSLGYIAGTNLKARNIIRRAYGYRDKECMKLRIIQACSSLGTFRPYGIDADNSS